MLFRSPGEVAGVDVQKHRAAWTEEWLRRRKERLRLGYLELVAEEQEQHQVAFRDHLLQTAQPQLLKRLETSGWQHRLVIGAFIRFYAQRVIGDSWDKPTTDDILEIAVEQSMASSRAV